MHHDRHFPWAPAPLPAPRRGAAAATPVCNCWLLGLLLVAFLVSLWLNAPR